MDDEVGHAVGGVEPGVDHLAAGPGDQDHALRTRQPQHPPRFGYPFFQHADHDRTIPGKENFDKREQRKTKGG